MSIQRALLLLLLGAVALAANAQERAPAPVLSSQRGGFDRIREADLRADLGFVSSDGLQGRMSLQPGDGAAIAWVAAEFAKAGLTPAATDNAGTPSFLQPVPLVEYRPNGANNVLTLTSGGVTRSWRAPDLVGGYRNDVDLAAPLAFAGYGITAPGLGYDDYRGLDARGRIVVVFEHEPQENDPHSRFGGTGSTRYATNRVKGLNAQAHGAVALVIVPEPNRKHPSIVELNARIGAGKPAPLLPSQALADDVLHIPVLVASDAVAKALLADASASPQDLQAAIDRDLQPRSRPLANAQATLHLENGVRSRSLSYNVVGLLPGSAPELAAETIIVSAHHDHNGTSGADIWHGADDNGSGTVGVVELARAFGANAAKPKRSILFVVFAAEERGLLGSYYLAEHPLRPLATTRAMINFDMIGRNEMPSEQTDGLISIPADTTNRLNLIGTRYSPDLSRTVQAADRSIGLTLDERFDHDSALNIFFRSDQFPFVLHDVPALWFFTGFHPDYHQATDTADKINYGKMTKIVRLAYLSAWRLADDALVPAFVPNPDGDQ